MILTRRRWGRKRPAKRARKKIGLYVLKLRRWKKTRR
jgi:hypothetical protein